MSVRRPTRATCQAPLEGRASRMVRTAAQWSVVVLLACCASLPRPSLSAIPFPGPRDTFCKRSVRWLSQCPGTPESPRIDPNALQGLWYEVAVDAQTAFSPLAQLGSQCVTAQWGSTASGANGAVVMGVQSNKVQLVAPARIAEVAVLSTTTSAVGLTLRGFCRTLEGTDSVAALLASIDATTISAEVRQAVKQIRARLDASSGLASDIYQSLAGIQLVTNYLNGVSAPARMRIGLVQRNIGQEAAKASLALRRLEIQRQGAAKASALIQKLVQDRLTTNAALRLMGLTGEGGAWYIGVKSMQGTVIAINDTAHSLGLVGLQSLAGTLLSGDVKNPQQFASQAVQSIQGLKVSNDQKANQIVNSATSLVSQIAQSLGVNVVVQGQPGAAGNNDLAGQSNAAQQYLLPGTAVAVNGSAVLDQQQTYRLNATFLKGPGHPYYLLDVQGDPATGLRTALFYSCSLNAATGMAPQFGLTLLSRKPYESPSVLAQAVAKAADKFNIIVGGEGVLLPVNQSPKVCTA